MSRDSGARNFALLRLGKANAQRDEARKEVEKWKDLACERSAGLKHERKHRAIAEADYLAEAERCREARAEVERLRGVLSDTLATLDNIGRVNDVSISREYARDRAVILRAALTPAAEDSDD